MIILLLWVWVLIIFLVLLSFCLCSFAFELLFCVWLNFLFLPLKVFLPSVSLPLLVYSVSIVFIYAMFAHLWVCLYGPAFPSFPASPSVLPWCLALCQSFACPSVSVFANQSVLILVFELLFDYLLTHTSYFGSTFGLK